MGALMEWIDNGMNPKAVRSGICDGEEVRSWHQQERRCTGTDSRVTLSDHGVIGSEPNAVIRATGDGDKVGIRRSVVALTASC